MGRKSVFICGSCGYESTGWLGKCPNCGEWNSLVETVIQQTGGKKGSSGKISQSAKAVKLTSITTSQTKRTKTTISELDRVLGGGVVDGQVVLIAGEPGIGKSTLLLQLADKMGSVLYVCGEESVSQVAIRAKRLGVTNSKISLLENTDVDSVVSEITSQDGLSAVIVDSIQTMTTSDLSGLSGSVGQVRECTFRLLKAAKEKGFVLFIVGHVTKEGTVAGPSVLAHIVDTVLWFEGDKTLTLRLLRAVKNRFGPTDEVGIFSMEGLGLVSQGDPEKLFLTKGKQTVSGSALSCIMQGTRPILVEIQSLVVPTKLAFPRRVAQGIDPKRLEMLISILIRRSGLPLYDSDVFVNIPGGIKATDPSVDLAVVLSVASSYFDKVLDNSLLIVGEVGLLGEIRPVPSQDKRAKEARRLGYKSLASSDSLKYVSQAVKTYLR